MNLHGHDTDRDALVAPGDGEEAPLAGPFEINMVQVLGNGSGSVMIAHGQDTVGYLTTLDIDMVDMTFGILRKVGIGECFFHGGMGGLERKKERKKGGKIFSMI
jgi:hypothetical protein